MKREKRLHNCTSGFPANVVLQDSYCTHIHCAHRVFTPYYFRRKLEVQRLQIEKQEQLLLERARIASELHDDLGSGLT